MSGIDGFRRDSPRERACGGHAIPPPETDTRRISTMLAAAMISLAARTNAPQRATEERTVLQPGEALTGS